MRPNRSGIFFILLGDNDIPKVVMQIADDQWYLLDDKSCHWDIPYNLNFTPSNDGGGTGYAWINDDYDFSADAMGDPGDLPTEEEARSVYLLFLAHLAEIGEIDTEFEEEDSDKIKVAFCYRMTS